MADHSSKHLANPSSARRLSGAFIALFLVAISVTACGGPNKELAQQYIKKAKEQLAMRQYIAALEFLDKALAADPKNVDGRFLKSETFYNTARVDEAAKIMVDSTRNFILDDVDAWCVNWLPYFHRCWSMG